MVRKHGVRKDEAQVLTSSSERNLVLSALEHDQLVKAKKHHIPRRRLKGLALVVLGGLRIYLLFMMAVVIYQVWVSTR